MQAGDGKVTSNLLLGSSPSLKPPPAFFRDHSGLARFVHHIPTGKVSLPRFNLHLGVFASGLPRTIASTTLGGLLRGCSSSSLPDVAEASWPCMHCALRFCVQGSPRAWRDAPVLEVSAEHTMATAGAGTHPSGHCHPAGLFCPPQRGRNGSPDRISSSFSVSGRGYTLKSKDYAC